MRRFVVSALILIVAVLGGGALWLRAKLHGSLPQLDGPARLAGLSASVSVDRDALGVPTLVAANRADLARALGYLHAQDRFFQMDLMRRRAAGELAEIFGRAALPLDERDRLHGFRALARRVLAQTEPAQRALLEAYADGVNAGLAALKARPFEYYVLRVRPQPWKPEDCALVAYAMALTLQGYNARYEQSLGVLRDVYGPRGVAFFAPLVTPSDAALDGSTAPLAPIPPPEVMNVRQESPPAATVGRARPPGGPQLSPTFLSAESNRPARRSGPTSVADFIPGSNSMAISGSRTATGAALLANDMHLELSVPNTWYRASLRCPGLSLTGVTLPGVPFLVVGSNGHIAWGLTNAQIDSSDLIVVTPTESPDLYRAPGGALLEYERRQEMIQIKGSKPETITYTATTLGPIVGRNADGRALALHWTLYDPRAINFNFTYLERAKTAGEAVDVARRLGVPALNFLVADSAGHIAWTIAGRLPKRVGYDGRFPTSWDYGDRRWDGLLDPTDVPVLTDPKAGCLWTANNRPLGGAALRVLGDGGYERPARGSQLRADLARISAPAAPRDLLAIELDDRAEFLARWRGLLLETLTPAALAEKSSRARLRAALDSWDGRASVGSSAYTGVRRFRQAVADRALEPIFAPCRSADPDFDWSRSQYEEAVWTLVHRRPMHLLAPIYRTWDDLLLAAADDVAAGAASPMRWGRRNTLRMRHPFGHLFPAWLTACLDMPAEELPGDADMPRVQSPDFGASERFAVSPGHESEGIFEMPGGQSGHPLSPFYRAGHEAWAHGLPTPFLPGPATHRLELTPGRARPPGGP